jgi:hypothetical protein
MNGNGTPSTSKRVNPNRERKPFKKESRNNSDAVLRKVVAV